MSDSYEVVTAALAGHARTLGDLATGLRSTLDTAGVNLTADAYGQIGQEFVTAAQEVVQRGQDSIRSEVDSIESATTGIRTTATAYEQQETETSTKFTAVSDDLHAGPSGPVATNTAAVTSLSHAAAPEKWTAPTGPVTTAPAAVISSPEASPAQQWAAPVMPVATTPAAVTPLSEAVPGQKWTAPTTPGTTTPAAATPLPTTTPESWTTPAVPRSLTADVAPSSSAMPPTDPIRLAALNLKNQGIASDVPQTIPSQPAIPPGANWGFQSPPPPSDPPSTSSFQDMNTTEQFRARFQVRNGVLSPAGDRLSSENIEAALREGPPGAIPLYSPVGTPDNQTPAIKFSTSDLATRADLTRGLMVLDPNQPDVNPQWPQLRDGLSNVVNSGNGPREMWVQVPAGTSADNLRTMLDTATNGLPGVQNLTVTFRDPSGNVLGAGARTPFP